MSEWDALRLGSLVSVRKGKLARLSPNPKDGFLPYLGAGALEGRIEAFAETSGAELATDKDVLMLWDGERAGLVGKGYEGVVASTVARLTPKDGLDTAFLFHTLCHKFDWIQARRTGTGVPHVPKDLCDILIVPIPKSAGEQRAIGRILDAADEAIAKTEALIAKLKAIKQGLLNDLLTRGLDENGELARSQPKSVIPISGIADIDPPLTMALPDMDEMVSFIPMTDVSDNGEWTGHQRRVLREVHRGYTPFQNNDVLFAKITPCMENGKGCHLDGLVNGIGFGSTEFFVLRAKPGFSARFIFYWMVTPIARRKATAFMIGSAGQQRVKRAFFDKFEVPLLPFAMQEKVTAILDVHEARIREEQEYLGKLKAIKKGLMQDLLTGRVRVNTNQETREE